MDSLQVINNLKNDEDEHKKFKYDDNSYSSSSTSNIPQNYQNGKEFKMEKPVSEEGSESEDSVDLYEEAFADRTTPVMTDDDDSKTGSGGELKKIGEIIGNIQISPIAGDQPPPTIPDPTPDQLPVIPDPTPDQPPVVPDPKPDQPPASPKPKDDPMDHPPPSPTPVTVIQKPVEEEQIQEPVTYDPTKLQMRKVVFNEFKQYLESNRPTTTTPAPLVYFYHYLFVFINNFGFYFKRTKQTKHKVGRQTSSKETLDKVTEIFSVALPAVCVKNEQNWHIRLQFLHEETKDRLDISMIDTPLYELFLLTFEILKF